MIGAAALLSAPAAADESHRGPPEVAADADWATRHLAEEHHISNFDAGAFFSLHDFDNRGFWDFEDIYATYGFKDESTKDIEDAKKDAAVNTVINMIDTNNDRLVSRKEWFQFVEAGKTLPDFGMGPGHHGDDEYEYEIHHWEKYHDENTKEEDLIHPEDIEHFRKHDELEAEAERILALSSRSIVAENIPDMFRVRR